MAHVVIIGASYGGTKVAHKVLTDVPQSKVTLIDPSDVFYFNIAAPRVVAKPKQVKPNQYLIPIVDKFKQYPKDRFTFVQGAATSVDTNRKSVQVEGHANPISYDYLVVASGSTTPGTIGEEAIPFKHTGADLREKIEAAQQRIAKADSIIIIIGAGPVGVETAGEIAESYPSKKVTLVSSHDQVLPNLKQSATKMAASSLENLGVKIVYSSRMTETKKEDSGEFTVRFDNGKTLTSSLVISAAGNLPNTSFMPKETLDSEGWVKVDHNLRVPSVKDNTVYALGDATIFKQRYFLKLQDQIPVVAANLKAAIKKTNGSKTYNSNDKMMIFVPIGSKVGTGQIGGWVPFSFMVAFAKGRDFLMSKAASSISA